MKLYCCLVTGAFTPTIVVSLQYPLSCFRVVEPSMSLRLLCIRGARLFSDILLTAERKTWICVVNPLQITMLETGIPEPLSRAHIFLNTVSQSIIPTAWESELRPSMNWPVYAITDLFLSSYSSNFTRKLSQLPNMVRGSPSFMLCLL